jgi:C2H2-type zinc finger/Zinc finger, C2H2 type
MCGRFSYAASHFRAEHPRRRNTTHVGPVPLLAPSETAETPQAKHYTRKPSLTLRWQDNEVYCPIEDCSDRFSSIQALVNHLNEKMLKVHHTKRVCLLCVLDPNTVRMKFDLHDRKKSHDHILRHFPPQLKCDQEKCSFATHDDIAFKYHQSSMHQIHNFKAGKKLHVCEICGNSYARKGELKRHLDSHSDKKAQCSRCGNWYAAYYIQRHEKAFCQYRDEENRKHQCPKCTRTYDTYDGLKSHLRRDHGQRDMIMNYAMSAGVVSEADKSLLEQLSTGPMIASPEGLNAPLETLTSVPGHSTSVSSQAPPILQHDYDLKTDPFLQLESKSLSSLKMSSGSTSLTSNITTNHPNIFSPIETTDAPHVPPESTPNRRQTSFGFAAQALISSPAVPLQDLPLNAPTDIVPAVGNVRRLKRRRNPIQLSPCLLEEQTYQLQMKKARMLD